MPLNVTKNYNHYNNNNHLVGDISCSAENSTSLAKNKLIQKLIIFFILSSVFSKSVER